MGNDGEKKNGKEKFIYTRYCERVSMKLGSCDRKYLYDPRELDLRSWSSVNFQTPRGGVGGGVEGRNKGRSPRSGSPRRKRFVKGNYSVLGANNGGIGYTLFARRVRDKNPGRVCCSRRAEPSPLPLLFSSPRPLLYVPVVTDPETWPVIGPTLAQ